MHQRQFVFAKRPVRTLSPVLAGIRASKSNPLTFPCGLHSGVERGLVILGRIPKRHLFTVAGAAHVGLLSQSSASCFPFNYGHGHVREHQNYAIVRPAAIGSNHNDDMVLSAIAIN
jgi:hypothetical protein